MKAIYYTCFELEEKAAKVVSVKKNKNNFISVTGDKIIMRIR